MAVNRELLWYQVLKACTVTFLAFLKIRGVQEVLPFGENFSEVSDMDQSSALGVALDVCLTASMIIHLDLREWCAAT